MNQLQSLVRDLESKDSSIRDKAALALVEIGNPVAIEPLLQAIARPENVDHRGTLVYALSAFNCEPHLELLVDLALTGNFEVSTGAFGIIEESTATPQAARRIKSQLQKHLNSKPSAEHQRLAREALSKLVVEAGV